MGRACNLSRRDFLRQSAAAAMLAGGGAAFAQAAPAAKPNFVIIFCDDLGYADVGCFGAKGIATPRLDRMAADGVRFTDFYSAAPVCTPSRAALMTGCYAQRVSLAEIPTEGRPHARVLFPQHTCGLNSDEITVAEILRDQGYATGCVGKWHLGHLPPFLPMRQGFDYYYGIPYSNDMTPAVVLRNDEVVEAEATQDTLTERYADEAVKFIRANKSRPFFLYLAHNMPHIPLHVSDRFRGKSPRGLYGDVIQSIDWSVGQVLDALAEEGLDQNTLVLFTSDNGPWLPHGEQGGLATPLRSGKGSTYEGGMREPCIFQWKGTIPAGTVCSELASTIDILPTFARLAGSAPPADRLIDGKDIRPLLLNPPDAKTPHEAYYFYSGNELHAVRSGDWKLRMELPLNSEDLYRNLPPNKFKLPQALYNLAIDPGEQKSVAKDHPDVVERLTKLAEAAREDLGDSLTGKTGKNIRPLGKA